LSWSLNADTISYTYTHNATIDGQSITFTFNPQTLCTDEAKTFAPITITFPIAPYNNIKAIYYDGDNCALQSKIAEAAAAV
jgi:hypothetical protein